MPSARGPSAVARRLSSNRWSCAENELGPDGLWALEARELALTHWIQVFAEAPVDSTGSISRPGSEATPRYTRLPLPSEALTPVAGANRRDPASWVMSRQSMASHHQSHLLSDRDLEVVLPCRFRSELSEPEIALAGPPGLTQSHRRSALVDEAPNQAC